MTDTSTHEAENQQAEANVLWLAELECPTAGGYRQGGEHDLACICQGTGSKYPQLREECTGWGSGCRYVEGRLDKSCECGKLTGWLPASREKAGTELRKLDAFVELKHDHSNVGTLGYWCMFHIRREGNVYCEEFAEDCDNATIAAARMMEEKC